MFYLNIKQSIKLQGFILFFYYLGNYKSESR